MKPIEARRKYKDILVFPLADRGVPLSRYFTVADFGEPGNEFIYVSQKLLEVLNKVSKRLPRLASQLTVKHHGTEISFQCHPVVDTLEYLKQFEIPVTIEGDIITLTYRG